MTRLFAGLIAVLAIAPTALAQPLPDHLKCFKVKDSQPKSSYVADLDGLLAETGCTIKFPAAMACVPTRKENVQPAPPGGGGTGIPNAFGCYKVKCPKGTPPPLQLDDQFGSRNVTPIRSKLLCAPAAAATCYEPFDAQLAPLLNAFEFSLGADGNLDLAPTCGGSAEMCCSGGTPTTPCGPLHVEVSQGSVVDVPVADRFDLSFTMHAETVSDIPIRASGFDCLMRIDSTPGASSTIEVTLSAIVSADRRRIESVANVSLSGLTEDDVTFSGGVGCTLIDGFKGFFIATLADAIASQFGGLAGLCRVCDSNAVAPCGP